MTREELEQIRYLDSELKMWERELARRRGKSLAASPLPRAAASSVISDRVADTGNDNVDLERRIEAHRAKIRQLRDEALPFVMSIPDSLTRMIVYYRCVSCMSWKRIAYEIGGDNTEENVRQIYSRFMRDLSRLSQTGVL